MATRLIRALTALIMVMVGLVGFTAVSAPAQAMDLNCDDFPNQAAAQRNLDANPSDPNGLDSEGDGVACESNPCPCARPGTSTPNPPSTPPKSQPKSQPKPAPRVLRVVKVIDGELVRVRLGSDRPYVIHQIGVKVPDSGCERRAARSALRRSLKPGTAIIAVNPRAVRDRDADGNQYQFIGLERRNKAVSVGLSQIAAGFADADRSLSYPFKAKYKRVNRAAEAAAVGYHGTCA